MKDILGAHFEEVKTNILNYLSRNKEQFSDIRIVKSIKLHVIDDSDESSRYRQNKALRQQILESEERYDLKWLSVLLLYLIDEDFENVAYTLKKLNYDSIPNEINEQLEILKRVSRLVYLYHDDKILDALENLMQHPASDSISTAEILWTQYHYYDMEEVDYDLLIAMSTIIIKKLPTEYSTYFFMGFLYVEQEDFQNALDSYVKALEICRKNSALYEQISWLYMRISDCNFNLRQHSEVIVNTDHALHYYNKYNAGKENQLELMHFVYKLRCRSYFTLKEYQLTLENANKALEYCEPENMDAMIELKETIENKCKV